MLSKLSSSFKCDSFLTQEMKRQHSELTLTFSKELLFN